MTTQNNNTNKTNQLFRESSLNSTLKYITETKQELDVKALLNKVTYETQGACSRSPTNS